MACCEEETSSTAYVIFAAGYLLISGYLLSSGGAAIGVGSWMIATNRGYDYAVGTPYLTAAEAMIVDGSTNIFLIGSILILICCGLICIDECGCWIVLLVMATYFWIFIWSSVLLEEAHFAGWWNETHPYFGVSHAHVSDKALHAIITYNGSNTGSSGAKEFIEGNQNELHCCGWNSYNDWLNSSYYIETSNFPASCECHSSSTTSRCVSVSSGQLIWTSACKDHVFHALWQYQIAKEIVLMTNLIIRLVPMAIACCLFKCFGSM